MNNITNETNVETDRMNTHMGIHVVRPTDRFIFGSTWMVTRGEIALRASASSASLALVRLPFVAQRQRGRVDARDGPPERAAERAGGGRADGEQAEDGMPCLLYTSPSPRD